MSFLIKKQSSQLFKCLLVGVTVATLSACSDGTSDLRDWVAEVNAKPPGRIKPMPEIIDYKPHDYQSAHLNSPFAELEPELESQLMALQDGCNESVRPDSSRRKEDLERYSLDSMEMVGLVNNNKKHWGLVRMTAGPAKGSVFPVKMGNYLGINHGKIVGIEEHQIEVSTLVPDSKGCWEKRTVYMALAQ